MPTDQRFNKLFKYATLEVGLCIGFTLVVLGIGGTGWAFSEWGESSFGELEPTKMLRVIIPAALSLILGLQIVLSSFFLSVLGLGRHRGEFD